MQQYASLGSAPKDKSKHTGQPVCDRCLQKIDQAAFSANLAGMQSSLAEREDTLALAQKAEHEAQVRAVMIGHGWPGSGAVC